MERPAELDSPAYKAMRAYVARRLLDHPQYGDKVTVNDDPDGPFLIPKDAVADDSDEPRWYEVTTKEAWPYLVEKHTPRYGTGIAIVFELPK